MIYGHLSAPDAYEHLLANEAWRFAFDWLKSVTPALEPGIRPLRGEDIWINVHGYDTLPPEQCRFESHRRYVDLQCCITGGECIDWALTSGLTVDTPYDPEKEVGFWQAPAGMVSTVRMVPGSYCVLQPSDAHRPKVRDGVHPATFKVVVKLDGRLLR